VVAARPAVARLGAERRDEGYARWKKAVERTPNRADVD